MRVVAAQLPDIEHSDDRVFTTDDGVIVLDGASAFVPVPVQAGAYADRLGRHLRDGLRRSPRVDLRELLSSAIDQTAQDFALIPGHSPSSTVAVVRVLGDQLEALVLGDTLLALPGEEITDDRLDRLDLAPRRDYRERLASGAGHDVAHRALLRQLQEQQAQMRNRKGGYWIAEADPAAAQHAIVVERSLADTPWAVLATDGAYETMRHLGLAEWAALTTMTQPELAATLRRCRAWESGVDPDGQKLPRAKRHDDKALAVVTFRA